MFESRIRELYPKMGFQFLKELKREFPRATNAAKDAPAGGAADKPVGHAQALEKLEAIAPGFQSWAKGFQE